MSTNNTIGSNQAPSVSVGEMKQMQVTSTTSSRQTFSDSLASKAVQFGGMVLNGASVIGGAVAGVLGSQVMSGAAAKLGGVGQQMASTGLSGPQQLHGATGVENVSMSGGPNPGSQMSSVGGLNTGAQVGAAGALPGGPSSVGSSMQGGPQTASSGQAAFGAGAAALPGGDGVGIGGGASIGGSSSVGGGQMGGAIGAAAGGDGQSQLLNATKQMQETQMSFNLQYLQLQSQMQHENRSYTAVSNIMKTKHDTVKNSISNIR